MPYDSKLARNDEIIRAMAARGHSALRIAEVVGATYAGVRLYCRRHMIMRDMSVAVTELSLPRVSKADQIRPLAEAGKTRYEIAEALSISYGYVSIIAKSNGIAICKRSCKRTTPTERETQMAHMYRQGLTLSKIGRHFGTSRQYIEQCLRKIGVKATEGGQAVQSRAKASQRDRDRVLSHARIEARWGVEVELWRELRAAGIVRSFEQQRQSSRNRGIAWELTFADWYAVWQASGKLHLRGRGKGKYCMSRIKDDGGYVLGNVHVQLSTINSQEAVEKWKGRTKQFRGVFCLYPGRERAWLAKVGKVSLGFYTSAEGAAMARDEYMAANGLYTPGAMRGIYVCHRRGCITAPYALLRDGRKLSGHTTREAAEAARAELLTAA